MLNSLSGYSTKNRRKPPKSEATEGWLCRAAYDFHGCLAHADITYSTRTIGEVDIEWVVGFFGHTSGCLDGLMTRCPPVPLHKHVYEVALAQLAQGAR